MAITKAKLLAMLEQAMQARENAYAPYSEFKVGAAALGGSGKVYTGCNIENASYGLSMCAERVAIHKAVSEGETRIVAVAIATGEKEIARPCGACLQVMEEFSSPEQPLVIAASSADGSYDVWAIDAYLPMPFKLEEQS